MNIILIIIICLPLLALFILFAVTKKRTEINNTKTASIIESNVILDSNEVDKYLNKE